MKSNIFKYIFIIFVIAITIFAVVKIQSDNEEQADNNQENVEKEKVTEITLGIASFDNINPIISNNKNIQDISRLIYEPLFTISSDYKLESCLAEEVAKQNATTYIVKLKDNVRWADGEKFIAEDVRFTIDKLKEIGSIYSSNVQHIASIEIVDDYTININLDQEVPFFEYNLTFPIMSYQYYLDKEFNSTIVPVGTGMYKVTDVQSSYITLVQNTNWWNTDVKPTLTKITVNIYSTIGEMYNSFKSGNIDLISTQNSDIQDYIGTIGYAAKELKGREHDFIAFNTQSTFLSRSEVRKAISYSIDKTNIVSSVFNNRYYTSSFPLDYGSWIYQEQDSSTGYNPDQAKQVLQDAGWTYRNKFWQKTENRRTRKLSLNLVVKASDSTRVAVAQNIKQQLENQGIEINIIQANNEQYTNYLNNKNYDMILCSINLSLSPDLTTFFGSNNLANYTNDEVNNIMEEVKNTTDENVLKERYKRLGEIYKNEVPYLSLYNNKFTVAYSTSLVGDVAPTWYDVFNNIESWYK